MSIASDRFGEKLRMTEMGRELPVASGKFWPKADDQLATNIQLTCSAAAATLLAVLLDGRARYRPIRAEDAAVTGFRLQHRVAMLTLVKPLTGIGGHAFRFDMPAVRTSQRRIQNHCTHFTTPFSVEG